MTRIVKTGTPSRLYRLKRNDLPGDKDLTHSFFEYVNLSGFDLSEYDLRDSTIYHCNAHDVKLGEGKTNWMESRFTDWTDSDLPSDISDWSWDFIKTIFDQHTPANPRESDVITKAMAVGQDDTYLHSWNEILHSEETEMGLTRGEVHTTNISLMAGYPRLLSRLDKMQTDDRIKPGSLVANMDLTHYTPPYTDVELDLTPDILNTHDRFEQALHLESVYPGVRFYVAANTPFTYVLSLGRDCSVKDDEWWWSEAWHG